jgi:glycosyltransferase involved in cell wall biosynthesis
MAAEKDLDFEVLYCCKKGVENAAPDIEFGVTLQWDIPLLRGYRYRFLRNWARHESLDGFFGLVNFEIIRILAQAPRKTVIWIHGWNYATHILALIAAKVYGHRVFLRGENTAVIENQNPDGWKKRFKKFYLSKLIFPLCHTFLAVGKQNVAFFKLMGVPENKMTFTPYCIDNQRFRAAAQELLGQKERLKKELGIPLSKKVFIFSGKYIEKKRPLDLLRALSLLPNREAFFAVFIGEGKLRQEMEQFIADHDLEQTVLLTGFINQSQIPQYYAAGDVFVMCSGSGETWGLSTNEAMCFGMPLILSDMVGSAYDLVAENGIVFPCGDVQKLADAIHSFVGLSETGFDRMGNRSRQLVEQYSYTQVIESIKQAALSPPHAPTPSYAVL